MARIIAKCIMPDTGKSGIIVTIILVIVGAVAGGYISTFFGLDKVDGYNFGSFIVTVISAIVVLYICKKVRA